MPSYNDATLFLLLLLVFTLGLALGAGLAALVALRSERNWLLKMAKKFGLEKPDA